MSETRADRPTREAWQQVDAEVRQQLASDIERLESTPLEVGAHIAWSECMLGRTSGLSALHRVGHPQLGYDHTSCGEVVPPAVRWLPLSPAMIRTLPRCKYCEAEHARILTEQAA